AGTDTAAAFTDTVTYTITVCNNSVNTQTGILSDITPTGFVTTGTTLPATVTLNSMQCDTFTVSGYFTSPGSCFYNVASVTSPMGTTWKDSVCVNVLNNCANTDTTFADSTFSGKKVYNNISIFIEGKYYVSDSLVLNNCTVYANAGSQIIVLANSTLVLNNTSIQSCDTMWQGILVSNEGRIYLQNNSTLKDADVGITTNKGSLAFIDSSRIVDCVRGIYAPPATGVTNTQISVSRSSFGLHASNFKPDYVGQPVHGAIPKNGIEVNNIVMTLGGTFGKNNQFFKMNNGIVAHNSQLTIRRSQFYDIYIDSVYTDNYHGFAIVCCKSNVFDPANAKLTVLPEVSSYSNVNNCYKGIYTRGASFNVNYVHLLNVKIGLYSETAPWLSTNSISNCTITASNHGLFFVNNPLARFVIADYNTISINGVNNPNQQFQSAYYAIQMRESFFGTVRYSAIGNYINMTNARFGIYAGFLSRASIKHNNIRFSGVGSGITVQSNTQTSVSCNTVNADYNSGLGGSIGINIGNLSSSTSMYCNSVDSTYRGIYFGGVNPNTYLKGTEFYHHFNGLYLNSSSNISSQTHFGNRWNNTTWSFQAENANIPGFQSSQFLVDSNLSNIYKPTNNISGWVQLTSGSTFYCSNSLVCSSPPPALTADSLEIMIANGILESVDYAEESQAIAAEYLYRLLEEDLALMLEDSAYVQFVLENTDEAVGLLYDAEEYLRAAYEFDTLYINLSDSAYNQIAILTDSITRGDENPPANWDIIREQLILAIDFLNQTIQNITILRDAMLNGNLVDAELINDIVIPENLPQENTQYINGIEINFQELSYDLEYLRENYEGIFAVALQCPYAGGPAVERARALLALLNDSIFYDDDNVCLQSGIYRSSGIDSSTVVEKLRFIYINPNPATNKVTITLIGKFEGLCNIEIKNSVGEIVLSKQTDCKNAVTDINISKIAAGFYSVKVQINNSNSVNSKLVIVR
ncbi:MAG TPA: T9SS type A sorting domain-containing protein, partial [Bacteroidia bacterium]|nr:T9SS type A sorting domain-containing protein [Bacteroidia bacterium]HMU20608.1 T9SS type A sorting domain-containing protein [Bacteroidia bacterium]